MTERKVYLEDIPVSEVLEQVEQGLIRIAKDAPLETEQVPLAEATGRITAKPIFARLSSPHYRAAAMDGYAVKAEETRTATETRPLRLSLQSVHAVNTGDPAGNRRGNCDRERAGVGR